MLMQWTYKYNKGIYALKRGLFKIEDELIELKKILMKKLICSRFEPIRWEEPTMTSMGLGRVIDSYDIDLAKKSDDLF